MDILLEIISLMLEGIIIANNFTHPLIDTIICMNSGIHIEPITDKFIKW
jgi:hypothetical protein